MAGSFFVVVVVVVVASDDSFFRIGPAIVGRQAVEQKKKIEHKTTRRVGKQWRHQVSAVRCLFGFFAASIRRRRRRRRGLGRPKERDRERERPSISPRKATARCEPRSLCSRTVTLPRPTIFNTHRRPASMSRARKNTVCLFVCLFDKPGTLFFPPSAREKARSRRRLDPTLGRDRHPTPSTA